MEIRTYLERMRPVEHKLKYQIEKLLKISSSGKFDDNDPLQFKANPNNLINKVVFLYNVISKCVLYNNLYGPPQVGDDEDSSDEETGNQKKTGVYVPPKLIPMKYGTFLPLFLPNLSDGLQYFHLF